MSARIYPDSSRGTREKPVFQLDQLDNYKTLLKSVNAYAKKISAQKKKNSLQQAGGIALAVAILVALSNIPIAVVYADDPTERNATLELFNKAAWLFYGIFLFFFCCIRYPMASAHNTARTLLPIGEVLVQKCGWKRSDYAGLLATATAVGIAAPDRESLYQLELKFLDVKYSLLTKIRLCEVNKRYQEQLVLVLEKPPKADVALREKSEPRP